MEDEESAKRKTLVAEREILKGFAASRDAYSLRLAAQLERMTTMPKGIIGMRHCDTGVLEFDIDIKKDLEFLTADAMGGYARTFWTVRVGGAGLDDCSPVTVRFVSPLFAHYAADDLGIPDGHRQDQPPSIKTK